MNTTMEVSIILAQFWGWLLVITGILFLLRTKFLEELFKLSKDKNFLMLSGWLAMIMGLITLILHPVLAGDWRIVITIFGAIAFLKGIFRLGIPEIAETVIKYFRKKINLVRMLCVIDMLLGAWLLWMSYIITL